MVGWVASNMLSVQYTNNCEGWVCGTPVAIWLGVFGVGAAWQWGDPMLDTVGRYVEYLSQYR